MEETNTTKREVCRPFSIKMYQEEIDRFKRLGSEMDGVTSDRTTLTALMDFFENPKKVVVDNPELISKIKELETRNAELEMRIESQNKEFAQLKQQLDSTIADSNESAMAAQRLQLELEASQTEMARLKEESENRAHVEENRPENVFEVEVHPVPFYFLRKMAEYLSKEKKTEITPGYILTDLFLKDLQNPRSNNLPYVVSTSEIEKVLNAYKKEHPEEYEKS